MCCPSRRRNTFVQFTRSSKSQKRSLCWGHLRSHLFWLRLQKFLCDDLDGVQSESSRSSQHFQVATQFGLGRNAEISPKPRIRTTKLIGTSSVEVSLTTYGFPGLTNKCCNTFIPTESMHQNFLTDVLYSDEADDENCDVNMCSLLDGYVSGHLCCYKENVTCSHVEQHNVFLTWQNFLSPGKSWHSFTRNLVVTAAGHLAALVHTRHSLTDLA